jgi:UDP-GlcNAc:undecaprenyl-phosphate GlcNAc-1-phosphate transferase
MPVGLIVAAVIMGIPDPGFGWIGLLAAVPLAGLAILDTSLVVVSRIRRGETVYQGGRDHLTHRMLVRLKTPQRVALGLATVQALLVAAAAVLYQLPEEALLAVGAVYIVLGAAAIAWLETPRIAGYLEPHPDRE